MNMKKFFLLMALAVVATVCLTACGNNDPGDDDFSYEELRDIPSMSYIEGLSIFKYWKANPSDIAALGGEIIPGTDKILFIIGLDADDNNNYKLIIGQSFTSSAVANYNKELGKNYLETGLYYFNEIEDIEIWLTGEAPGVPPTDLTSGEIFSKTSDEYIASFSNLTEKSVYLFIPGLIDLPEGMECPAIELTALNMDTEPSAFTWFPIPFQQAYLK